MSAVHSLVVAGETVVGGIVIKVDVGIRRLGVVGIGTAFSVVVVVFFTRARSMFCKVDDSACVSGKGTTDEAHVLLKSSSDNDHIILPPYPSRASHSAWKNRHVFS